jgi:hypothetical protein
VVWCTIGSSGEVPGERKPVIRDDDGGDDDDDDDVDYRFQNGCGAYTASRPMGTGGSFLGVKTAGS